MKIFITGATGFIGRALAKRLYERGHEVYAASRCHPNNANMGYISVPCDFMFDLKPDVWLERLQGVDLVINAVGVIQQTSSQKFDEIQSLAPIALFTAAIELNIPIIQISGLGADRDDCVFDFLESKRAADNFLWNSAKRAVIAYPSIVIGGGGASTELFTSLAVQPLVGLVGEGEQRINPIHIDELAKVIVHVAENFPEEKQKLYLVGPKVYSLKELFAELRQWSGFGKGLYLAIPMPLMLLFARISQRLNLSTLTPDSLGMLLSAQTPSANYAGCAIEPLAVGLARSKPTPAEILGYCVKPWLTVAWLSLAMVWIMTGLTSVFFNLSAGRALMASAGFTGVIADIAIYAGGVLDLLLGFAMLFRWRWVYGAQLLLMMSYMVVVSLILPEQWLDPLGSITKNLPMLVLTIILGLVARPKTIKN